MCSFMKHVYMVGPGETTQVFPAEGKPDPQDRKCKEKQMSINMVEILKWNRKQQLKSKTMASHQRGWRMLIVIMLYKFKSQ